MNSSCLFKGECSYETDDNIPKCDEQKILTRVHYHLEPLMANGVKFFGVGGAVGFDMIVAEYLLDLRD